MDGFGVGDSGLEVEDTPHRDRILKSARIQTQKRRSRVRKSGCTAESEFEGGFEEVAAEDHEVVAVAVLGLHYLRGGEGCGGHVVGVGGFAEWVVGICPVD